MNRIQANGVDLAYESFGDPGHPALLLVMGLGTQMIAWPDAFIAGLVDRGFHVIRFDNRDIGKSTWLSGARVPNPLWLLMATRLGLRPAVPYSLTDMANDAVGLLDALGIDRAHVVGASMGGMIAQIIASSAPARTRSLTSIMSSSGARNLPGPSREVRRRMLRRRPAEMTREQIIAESADGLRFMSYPDPARAPGAYADLAARAYDRGYNPGGVRRQLAAIITDGSRVARLKRIAAPTLVIHGAADPLVVAVAGEDTARHITGARFELIERMGHDLPPSEVPRLVDLIASHAGAAA